jgi:hypothetical protein
MKKDTQKKRPVGRPAYRHPGGRPPSIDADVLRKLEEAFLLGCTDLEACLAAGISKTTLYKYQDENPDFAERKAELKENPVYIARQSVLKGIVDDSKLAFDYLKHKKSDEFSDKKKVELSTPPDKPLEFVFKVISDHPDNEESD